MAIGGGLTALLAVTLPRLPPGVCWGDAGELQLASAALGVAHPPGYAILVSLGHLLTRLPGIEPAYVISLVCLGSGLLAAVFAILFQIRLGVHPAAAAAVMLFWSAHPRVWNNLVSPEVYMPALAILAGSAVCLYRFTRFGQPKVLWLSAFLYGVAAAARPSTLLALPFFVGVWWRYGRRSDRSWKSSCLHLVALAGLAALPQIYCWGYLWLRDRPSTVYNYVEQYNAEFAMLPDTNQGWRAKLERLFWLRSAAQFGQHMGNTAGGVIKKMRWVVQDTFQRDLGWITAGAILLPLGGYRTVRRSPPAFWLLAGLSIASVLFVCFYRVFGQAADLLPLLWVGGVFCGVALARVLPDSASRVRQMVAWALFIGVGTWSLLDAGRRPPVGTRADAEPFLAKVDMQSLPPGTVICSHWGTSPPLWYEQLIRGRGGQIRILHAREGEWRRLAEGVPKRALYATSASASLFDSPPVAERGMWRFDADAKDADPND